MVKQIHVVYHLQIEPAVRGTAERVHGFHKEHCPVARTIGKCVEITTELNMQDLD